MARGRNLALEEWANTGRGRRSADGAAAELLACCCTVVYYIRLVPSSSAETTTTTPRAPSVIKREQKESDALL